MNKGLFCALCCIGVAGYASVEEKDEDLGSTLQRNLQNVIKKSPDYRRLTGLDSIKNTLEEGCCLAEQWQEKKKDWDKTFSQIGSLLERKLTLKLLGQQSEEQEQEVKKISEEVANLLEQIVSDLSSFMESTNYEDRWVNVRYAINYGG